MTDHEHHAGRGYRKGCPGCSAQRKAANDRHRGKNGGALARAENWKRQGITNIETAEGLHQAGGGCHICGSTSRRMHMDHDHKTGKVRGRLCGPCNQALGLMNDDPARLRAAADYLGGANGTSTPGQRSTPSLDAPTP